MLVQAVLDAAADAGFGKIRGNQTAAQTRLIAFAQAGENKICTYLPWPFMRASATPTTTANATTLTGMPADFSRVLTLWNKDIGYRLPVVDLRRVRERYEPSVLSAGPPSYCYFVGEQLNVTPKADGVYNLILDYVKIPATLTIGGSSGIPDRHADVLVNYVLMRAAMQENADDDAALYRGYYQECLASMTNDLMQQQFSDAPHMTDRYDDEDFALGVYLT